MERAAIVRSLFLIRHDHVRAECVDVIFELFAGGPWRQTRHRLLDAVRQFTRELPVALLMLDQGGIEMPPGLLKVGRSPCLIQPARQCVRDLGLGRDIVGAASVTRYPRVEMPVDAPRRPAGETLSV